MCYNIGRKRGKHIMNLELLNKIIKNGEEIDTYKIKNKIYHKIVYDNKVYVITEDKKGIRLEREEKIL